ncbi:hypothetical protein BD324DRAFT_630156 [Kockovaella imperatae]|uniref:Phytanoyl-CoA dioxygenase n=1 Tax=Kockovaella imperatae TaxID=4999 RepID=A0A1Y1UDG5_9TREE|nr:hypothetical protein BD324DRAFT_630156 [Kockovaella imperatae]ORX36098.1 hypothetical protein BD324DRAFT_630156 [Kockovaella imperatae]
MVQSITGMEPSSKLYSRRRLVQENVEEDMELLKHLSELKTDASHYPHAKDIVGNIPVYSGPELLNLIYAGDSSREEIMDELHQCLFTGPGVLIIKEMMEPEMCVRAHEFMKTITPGIETSTHKRTPRFGEKQAKAKPEDYAGYYSNPILAMVCEAWLGLGYQITTQSNAIRAGSDQQEIHRDYHMSHWGDRCRQFPLATHVANQFLTLQCAIAHTPQPLTSGPTRFLPYSNHHPNGYLNIRRQEFKDFVKPRMSQMPLEVGDAAFFNPSTYHQPGVNEQDVHRAMNLFQVNSCMSRCMDTKDTAGMTKAIWPVLKQWHKEIQGSTGSGTERFVNGTKTERHPLELEALINATAEGYEYPINSDKEAPSPRVETDIVRTALREGWDDEKLYKMLDLSAARRLNA